MDHNVDHADDAAHQELKRHRPLLLDRTGRRAIERLCRPCNRLQFFGAKAPSLPSEQNFTIVGRRSHWSWKNSDWILTASCMDGSAIEGVGVTNSLTE